MTEAESQGLEGHDEGRVDAENPWPGLASFREQDEEFFRGRDAETESLERLVLRDRLTVVFGMSGLGKTSLLRAGLFPRLRPRHILPVYIRLDYSEREPDLRKQVLDAVMHAAEESHVEAPAGTAGCSLWEYFHRRNADFWNDRNQLVTPLLVFDQFEEIFTLGKSSPACARAKRNLVGELADLVEGHPPAELRDELDNVPDKAREFSYKRHAYKILLSFREDFLPHLEELRVEIPSIIHNRLRLQHMTGDSAMQVVTQVPELISEEVAQCVVRFVAAVEDGDGEISLSEMEIEPAQLCVVCRELNNKRRAKREPMITADLLAGTRDQILVDLYEQSIADLAPEVRTLIEERLLTVSGFRDSLAYDNALETPGVTRDHIDKLINRRLLRAEERGGVRRIELTHDLLTGVIAESRNARRRREEAKARQRKVVKRLRAKHRRWVKAIRIVAAVFASAAVAAVIIAWVANEQKNQAKDLNQVLEEERACREGDARQCRKLRGSLGHKAGESETFSSLFLGMACNLSNAGACVKLGALYESGKAGALDAKRASSRLYVKAFELYKRRCDKGDAESCGGLAALYDKGRGVRQDSDRAAELHQGACDEGFARSCSDLGVFLQWGRGLPRNETRAAGLFRQACEAGSPGGCYNLGLLYRWGPDVEKNEKRVGEQASKEEKTDGRSCLGWRLYTWGNGVPEKEPECAAELYDKACTEGSADACARLGRLYWKGIGVKKDGKHSARLYEEACEAGSGWGCRQLGNVYEKGPEGVPRDPREMFASYLQACDQGTASACYRLGLYHDKAKEDPAAAVYAAKLYQRACDRGSGSGCVKLGKLFQKGDVVLLDEQRAASLFQQACGRGNPQGCELIRILGEAPAVGSITQEQISAIEQNCQNGDVPTCIRLGRHRESLHQFAEAERWYASAVILGTASNASEAVYADSLHALTAFYTRIGQYEKAEPWYALYRSIALNREVLRGDDDLVYAHAMTDSAALYVIRGKYTAAKSEYSKAIRIQEAAIRKSALKEDDQSYVTSLTNLASLYALSKYDLAEKTYESALKGQASAVGKEHPSYANLLTLQAVFHERTGRLASAEMLLKGSLGVREAAFGPRDLRVVSNLIDLALLYEKAGWDSEAEPLYRSALTIATTTTGTNSPYYTTSVNNLANLYMRAGRLDEAERLLRQEQLSPLVECRDPLYKRTLDTLETLMDLERRSEAPSSG